MNEQRQFTPDYMTHQFGAPMPDQERLKKESGFFRVQNTDPKQTHVILNRHLVGIELRPGETKEIEMLTDEVQRLAEKSRPGRFLRNGTQAPLHPVRVLELEPALEEARKRFDAEHQAQQPDPDKNEQQPTQPAQKQTAQPHRK